MGNIRIIIYGIPRVKDIGMVLQNHFHFSFENEDKFLSIVYGGFRSLNSSGFQSDDERLHMAVLLLKPQRLV
jgi:hypothetical protein